MLADFAIMEMYRQGVINVQRIADIHNEWHEPSFEYFEDFSAWRMFNAVTHALEGKVAENPAAQKLHNIIDGVCERVH